jgi:dTDP-4-amino-4,6-dideoxygalactose transaminase
LGVVTRVPFLDLGRQVAAIRDELDAAIASVLESGRFVGGGPVEQFEREFASWCGTSHAVAVASGTDAITIALQAVGVGPGDEVITVANTCVPTVVGIEQSGAVPVLVDALPESMTIDPAQVAEAIGPRTRALVPVHLYGRCADMDPLLQLAREHALKVVEDCAQAHGAAYRGRRAGTMGHAAAFSFYPTKNLGGLGDGGAVITMDERIARAVRQLRTYGETRQYDSVRNGGRNSRLDALQAATLSVKLRHLDGWNTRRRAIATRYHEAVVATGLSPPVSPSDGVHAYHLYVIPVSNRGTFRSGLAESGVETLVHYPRAVHEHPAYAHLANPGRLEASERLCREVVSLPLYPELSDAEVDAVIAAFTAASVSRLA